MWIETNRKTENPKRIGQEKKTKENIDLFEQALLSLDRLTAWKILQTDEGRPIQMVEEIVVPVLERIGEGWNQGRIALSQVYMSGRICEEIVDSFLPGEALERKHQPSMAIAVLEDFHLLGKRIVYSALRACGYELKDYGRATTDELVDRVIDNHVKILLVSALMLPSALKVKTLVTKLKQTGADVKVIVGGAPFLFDNHLWKTVGADAMGKNATEAIKIIDGMTGDSS